jgi:hypothetical protein
VNSRVSWTELPAGVRRRIEAEAGPFARAEQVGAGHNCLAALIVHTTAGSWFIKGVRADHARALWNQSNEAAINPYVEAVTATLQFRVQADGWDMLGFRYLAGHRHASLAPGSPDLPLIAATLQTLTVLPAPDDVPLRTIEDRWHGYIGDHAALLALPQPPGAGQPTADYLPPGTAELSISRQLEPGTLAARARHPGRRPTASPVAARAGWSGGPEKRRRGPACRSFAARDGWSRTGQFI